MKNKLFDWLNDGPMYRIISDKNLGKVKKIYGEELRKEWEKETMEFVKVYNTLESKYYTLEKDYNELLQKSLIKEATPVKEEKPARQTRNKKPEKVKKNDLDKILEEAREEVKEDVENE